jgi:endonuclease/exonuclease/phosphatase family metal-dependent hydrolase
MPLLFHQNMRVFGGAAAARNAVFLTRLGAIRAAVPQPIIVAGFTEVMNSGPRLCVVMPVFGTALNLAITSTAMVEIGVTAVGGQRECIAIAWSPAALTVDHIGQVLWNSTTRTWVCHNQTMTMADHGAAAGIPTTLRKELPDLDGIGADSRGLAYIAAHEPMGDAYIIAFMHNMFTLGNRSGAFGSLPKMWQAARVALALDPLYNLAAGTPRMIVGGDFNVWPRDSSVRGLARGYGRAARSGGPASAWVRTTSRNPYDFWVVSDVNIVDAHVAVHTQTRVPSGSDHAGITLAV